MVVMTSIVSLLVRHANLHELLFNDGNDTTMLN
jgi:hypothetical protein